MRKYKINLLFPLLAAVFAVMSVTSCRTQYYPVVEERHDTIYQQSVRVDSIEVRDSVYVREWTVRDTTYVYRDRWHTEYRDRLLWDTLYIAQSEKIPQPYPVERELTWWEQVKMDWGGKAMIILAVLTLALLGWGGYKVWKMWRGVTMLL